MKKALIVFFLLVASGFLSAATPTTQKWQGRISDQRCGRNIDSACTKKCLASGIPPILVVENSNEVLLLSPANLFQQLAGKEVEVTGVRSGDVLKATSVRALFNSRSQYAQPDVDRYRGNYRVAADHVIGIDTFINDSGSEVLLFSDYKSGVVRELFEVSEQKYEFGPGFAIRSPAQATVQFDMANGAVTELELRSPEGRVQTASKIATSEQEVSFRSGDAILHGTLIKPLSHGPKPAVVLLHGSGPLTRSSFGPYTRFFVSLGFAVLVYDKRSAGASTGEYLPDNSFYPQPFVEDALAAVAFLKSQAGILPTQIGLWGSSEGGMLTTQVAAQSKDIAFIINCSGFMMPLWKEMLYNRTAELRAEGYSKAEAEEAAIYQQQLFDVGRTGEGWAALHRNTIKFERRKWFARFFATETPSIEQLRWRWQHVYSFDPLPKVAKVHCPVLGLFGTLDTSTPYQIAIANMQKALTKGGDRNVTLRIFQHANHSLTMAKTGADAENKSAPGLVPGVFATIRSWLQRSGGVALDKGRVAQASLDLP